MDDEAPAGRTAAGGDRVRGWVEEDFALDLVSMDEVGHGADDSAQLWRGNAADGARYAVKLSGGGTPAGLVVTAHLARQDVRGIAAPVPTLQGRMWSDREDRRLSVVPWVSDDRALAGPMSAAHWTAYGELLAQVHATDATDELASLLPREDHTHEQLTSTARALQLEWPAVAGVIASLLDHVDRLGRELRAREAPTVICHGDPHLGNVLFGGDDRVWLVDWDDAVLAPRELDLIFVIGGVLASAPVTAEEQSWFFGGYGDIDLDPDRLAYYRCTRALVDLVDPAAQAADVRLSERERANAMSIVEGVLSPTGLATLALSSVGNAGHGRRP